ncbi:hypothetical protein IU433_06645 [Nocardia puris]|uniref:MFS transporter n=1 Tax=Nocardia puris TaxID=208602 RepID=A0A366DCL8_9NOCA|nr:hypothetical protein [Nocardia puris]MBF6211213.1 hypothetical protein [Nocardia puris]MBF6364932.1 hypothetical protein [Nocardia puris]MBF6458718.1 hypothetical protein [Nocardia puris]RBO87783.1 hypothetical protein DFR74_11036 [Nocardia puris]
MRQRIGAAVDATAAFFGASVAGIALLLPIAFSWTAAGTPTHVAGLVASVPRGATIGMVVAVTVAVLICSFARPATGWLVAFAGALGILVNHSAGRAATSADLLITQNYVDSVCAGVALGALGAAVLRTSLPALGFALGAGGVVAVGDLADVLGIPGQDPWAVLETPPRWLIAAAVPLLLIAAIRHRGRATSDEGDSGATTTIDLPITPILASLVLGLVILAASEWLSRQYSHVSAPGDNRLDIAIAVAATVVAAFVAAMLLPGRDGAGVLLAVALTAAADALGAAPRPTWSLFAVIVLVALGLYAGLKAPAPFAALVLIAGLCVLASTLTNQGDKTFVAGTAALALTVGYSCGAARPRYGPSGVLALGALYLPSVVTALPVDGAVWPPRDNTADPATPGRVALIVTGCCALALLILYRMRPRPRTSGKATDPGVGGDVRNTRSWP